jgi:Golgi-body localisation protein domain/RNA pol II promoter Fmp27 protein domain
MSLPVRQGPLWPGITKTSKKFGRHLATVKYKLLLSPLFASHIYKHKDPEDYGEDVVTATGIKVRLANFKFDLHQRRERLNTPIKGRLKQLKSSAMRINRAELDFEAADFRAVSASIEGTTLDEVLEDQADIVESFQQPVVSVDVSRFSIPDQDYTWIDMDDFVELDWILPQESNPKTKILPLAYTPRFTYFRQTDHGHAPTSDKGDSQFGDEPTHNCVMSQGNDPWQVQMDLIKDRLKTLEIQTANHEHQLSEHEIQLQNADGENNDMKVKHELMVRQAESLTRRHKFLESGLRRLEKLVAGEGSMHEDCHDSEISSGTREDMESESDNDDKKMDGNYEPPDIDSANDFNNRFTIHNPQVKWNNALRDIMVRYGHQVSQRRGFVYYMSQQAVKFISDIVEEQNKHTERRKAFFRQSANRGGEKEHDDDDSVQDRIEQLLHDAKRYVNADDPSAASTTDRVRPHSSDFSENISPEFTSQRSYHLRLIAPQIQLQSDKNPRSVTLVTAKGMTLKVLSIMDKRRVSDDVSGLVQRRYSLDMDGAQFFVATQKNLKAHLQFYAGNKYGNAPGSAWPPWLTLEAMFDFELLPFGFSRIIQRTSASLRYDKFNNLRLKYNDEVVGGDGDSHHYHDVDEGRVDQVWVEFPDVRVICDSTEYYSTYIIVLDLLLYSEPLEKVRSEKLEKIMYASDFSDLRGAPETVFKLQERIRQFEEIKEYFQVQAHRLDAKGWQDRITLERDLANCEEELFFIMKAITTSQRRTDERTLSKSRASMRYCLSASDIVWHLMRDRNEPLVEFQLRNASYERTDNTDGSNHNVMEIQRLYALNLLENAVYPQMIVPYMDHKSRTEMSGDMMFRVQWYMLEAVAGIPVLDQFEVNMFPLKVQLERELGKKLFEYIFPGVGSNAFENGAFSPFMVKHIKPMDEDEDEEDGDDIATPDFVPTPRSHSSTSTGEDLHALTGTGSIELRLQPTMTLPDNNRKAAQPSRPNRLKVPPLTRMNRDGNRSLQPDKPGLNLRSSANSVLSKKKSAESMRALTRTSTEKSIAAGSIASGSTGEIKKFSLVKGSKKEQTDDLTQMMSRASNYMILAHVKINDVVLCLSYKGRGDRNIEDVHNFVFRLPVLEYRNKTWSNLELALRLKTDVIKALISHAPAILGNKFSHPRPSKQQQQKLRELASSSQILPASDTALNSSYSPTSATQSLNSRDTTGSKRFHLNHAATSPSTSSAHSTAVSAGTYPLGKSISYSSGKASSLREPSIMINDSPVARDNNSAVILNHDGSASKQDLREERPKTSQSMGGISQDET